MLDIIFDQYQRYKKIEEIINTLRVDDEVFRILEVGANEHRNLEKFLPRDKVTYLDIREPQFIPEDMVFIVGDATDMHLEDKSFDIVVASDVYEHIPKNRRELFLSEMNRVAIKFFVMGAPFGTQAVTKAELRVNSYFKAIFHQEHPWLIEHIQYGLPDFEEMLELLDSKAVEHFSLSHGEIKLWEALMNVQYILTRKSNVSTELNEIFRYYNEFVYPFDVGEDNYRQFVIVGSGNHYDFSKLKKLLNPSEIDVNQADKLSELHRLMLTSSIAEFKNLSIELKNLEREIKKQEIANAEKEKTYIKMIADKDRHIYNLENKYKPAFVKKRIVDIFKHKKVRKKLKRKLKPVWSIAKKTNPRNIRKAISYTRKYGIKALYLKAIKNNIVLDYGKWFSSNQPGKTQIANQRNKKFEYAPKISIIVPTYNTPKQYLTEMIDSVQNQTYSNWELCISDGNSSDQEMKQLLRTYVENDPRIKCVFLDENKGISGNTNEGVNLATGEFIGLLDHDDLLTCNALYEVVKALNVDNRLDVVYSDEDKTDEKTKEFFEPHFKPDFSPDTLRSYNYICHFLVFRRSLLDQVGRFDGKYDGAQDHDLVLRLTEHSNRIKHIPKVLYHWRVHQSSTAANMGAKSYATEAGKKAIAAQLDRMGLQGSVKDGLFIGSYKVDYDIIGNPKVSIIIPNKDETATLRNCIVSILDHTTYSNYEIIIVENNSSTKEIFAYYEELKQNSKIKVVEWKQGFNYSAINNYAMKYAAGEYAVLLNNDIEIITNEWIEEMLMFAQREDVGIVGAKLYYPDDTVQHAGVILGIGGVAGHSHKYFGRNENGFIGRLKVVQNLSAVTAACMMVKTSLYLAVDGLDENYQVAFNDIDFCMKIRELHKLIVFNPYVEMYHYESKSRGHEDTPEKVNRFKREMYLFRDKWGLWLDDPYYSINLTKEKEDFSLNIDNEAPTGSH